jgi:hypothetical protein
MMINRKIAEQSVATDVTGQLRERVSGYFPELAGHQPHIRLVTQRNRLNSVLCAFVVSTDAGDQRLLVKFARDRTAARSTVNGAANSRPRLFPMPDSDRKTELEFSALSRIRDHFIGLHDSRFGVLRPLDYLREQRALVLEHVLHPSLSRLLTKSCRFTLRRTNLETAIRNAGAWLRVYHRLPGLAHTRDRHETRSDFLQSVGEFVSFLAAANSDTQWIGSIAAQVESAADSMLPQMLPLGMSHGDFAPRNIFLGPGEQVIVFDTLARWRAPIYEDIAHFLIALKLARAQVYSLGCAFSETMIARYERAFLRGYFEDDVIPFGAIRLFEKLVLMDKWASLIHQHQRSTGISRLTRLAVLSLWSLGIRRYLDQPVLPPAVQSVREVSYAT